MHTHNSSNNNLKIAFFLNVAFTVLEFIAGAYVNSVAIIADAIHDLGDSLSLGTAWFLQSKSKQKATHSYSFGYRRFSLLGALINCVVLISGSIYATIEIIERFMQPQMPKAYEMMWFAVLGVIVNGYAAWKLSSGKSMNEKVVSWHLLEDVLGWLMVLIAAVVMQFKDIPLLDPALSVLITLFILWNAFKKLKATLYLFLQGTPKDISKEKIISEILEIKSVLALHDTHIWSLDGEHHVFTTHVKLAPLNTFSELIRVKQEIKQLLSKYHFEHYTIETDLDKENCEFEKEL